MYAWTGQKASEKAVNFEGAPSKFYGRLRHMDECDTLYLWRSVLTWAHLSQKQSLHKPLAVAQWSNETLLTRGQHWEV